jgi:hypothetical protein
MIKKALESQIEAHFGKGYFFKKLSFVLSGEREITFSVIDLDARLKLVNSFT